MIFNVGSIGNSLDDDNRISYGVLEFYENKVDFINRRISYPVSGVINFKGSTKMELELKLNSLYICVKKWKEQ